MIARSFVAAALAAVFASSAHATTRGYWDLWALDVALICFAQNPAYRNTPLGNAVSNSYGFSWEALDREPSAACLRSRQWISDSLCTEVTNLDEKTFRDLNWLGRKHEAELQGLKLKEAIVYRYKSREPNGGSIPCPAAN
jgi:hypothetical protein